MRRSQLLLRNTPQHPTDRRVRSYGQSSVPLQVSEDCVFEAIRSFPAGSSGGPDGFRPQHLRDLVGCKQTPSDLLRSITALREPASLGSVPRCSSAFPFRGKTDSTPEEDRRHQTNCDWLRLATACSQNAPHAMQHPS